MRDDALFVLGLEGVELASKFAQGGFGVAEAEGSGFFEGREGGGDSGEGGFVREDVEICYCVVDELEMLLV